MHACHTYLVRTSETRSAKLAVFLLISHTDSASDRLCPGTTPLRYILIYCNVLQCVSVAQTPRFPGIRPLRSALP